MKTNQKNKPNMTKVKTFFIIINLVIAVASFSYLISAQLQWIDKNKPGYIPLGDEKWSVIEEYHDKHGTPPQSGCPTCPNYKAPTDPLWQDINKKFSEQGWESISQENYAQDFSREIQQQQPSPGTIPLPNEGSGGATNPSPIAPPSQQTPAPISPDSPPPQQAPPKNIPGTPGERGFKEYAGRVPGAIQDYFKTDLLQNILTAAGIGALGAVLGGLAGGENGQLWGFVSAFTGAIIYQLASKVFAGVAGGGLISAGLGLVGGGIIFLLTYKKVFIKTVEFNCLNYQPPIGGEYCELCNDYKECSEYTCKSLGQACNLVNKGTEHEKCIWINPHDVTSPIIRLFVPDDYRTIPFSSVRPPATGVEIKPKSDNCIQAFTPLEFTIVSDEPAQCKIDYNLTSFEQMSYYVGGDILFSYNHTEILSLPGPDSINKAAPEIKNDGIYTLYSSCQDANGNKNENAFAIRFCVEPGPDLTAPIIKGTSIPSGSPIQFNKTTLNLEVYVNEPSECKWSRQDIDYEIMEKEMDCNTNLWEMNNKNTYTCRAVLEGIEDRKENNFFFKCKDQPGIADSDRNTNTESYPYRIIGTQPLNILEIKPSGTIKGASDTIPVFLKIKTDNGFKNGEAICYYSLTQNEQDYIEFLETNSNLHEQRQDLPTGNYKFYLKCVDLGGNAVYNFTSFRVETDKQKPTVVRTYKESGNLKIITSETAECAYSFKDCNFEIDDGIRITTTDYINHVTEWKPNKKFYIRCRDKYNNQPNPNTCSMIVVPWNIQ